VYVCQHFCSWSRIDNVSKPPIAENTSADFSAVSAAYSWAMSGDTHRAINWI
jgi:hypothetical protein